MNFVEISLAGATLAALPSGALWWPEKQLLCVSDLHLGKSERLARRGGAPLPPYEGIDTLQRLSDDLDRTKPARVICLGDSFDDQTAAENLPDRERQFIARLQAGRHWVWIEGNHDPGPVDIGGEHRAEIALDRLIFRHIAQPGTCGEVSGHYHPKLHLATRLRRITKAVFLFDTNRLILPAYGTYTGGLSCEDPVFDKLMCHPCFAVLTGKVQRQVPIRHGRVCSAEHDRREIKGGYG